VGYDWIGITQIEQLTYQCQVIYRKKSQEYGHTIPNRVQTCPYAFEPKKFGTKAQAPRPHDAPPKLDAKGI
jgi:hypothetical protein